MLLPIFHENKYTHEEFDKICQEAKEKAKNPRDYINTKEYSIYVLYHVLIEEYGFKGLNDKVLSFNLNDCKTKLLKEDEELDILLNISPL